MTSIRIPTLVRGGADDAGAAGSNAASRAGLASYDPFAGAAPLQRRPGKVAAKVQIDDQKLREIAEALKERGPPYSGPLVITIKLSKNGWIEQAFVLSSEGGADWSDACADLIGMRLLDATATAAQQVRIRILL